MKVSVDPIKSEARQFNSFTEMSWLLYKSTARGAVH